MVCEKIALTKKMVKKILNAAGLDVVKRPRSPMQSLLGLKGLSIRTIIDVGANEGQFTKTISGIFPEADIYCFEPLTAPYGKLLKWAERQGSGRLKVYNLALGDRKGTLEMLSHVRHDSSSSFLNTTELCEDVYPFTREKVSIPVKLITLDEWAKSLPIELTPEVLIKLDVQGYEDRVIKGGINTFRTAKACILEINLWNLYEGQAAFKDISLLLYDFDYHYTGNLNQVYDNSGRVISIDAVFVR